MNSCARSGPGGGPPGNTSGLTRVRDLRSKTVGALIAQHPADTGSRGVQTTVDYLKPGK